MTKQMDVLFVHVRNPPSYDKTSFEHFCTSLDINIPIPGLLDGGNCTGDIYVLCISDMNECERIVSKYGYKIMYHYTKVVDESRYNNKYSVKCGWHGSHSLVLHQTK